MVHMSELHKVFKFVRKEVVWITFWIFDFIEQNGPNRKKYAMKKRKSRIFLLMFFRMIKGHA